MFQLAGSRLMRSAAAFGIASSLLLVGCASDPVSRSVQPTTAPSPQVPGGLDFDEACEEYGRVAQLTNQGNIRAAEAFSNQNFEVGASISRNHIELLSQLSSRSISDQNLSQLISTFVSTSIEVENYFIDLAEVVSIYGVGSSEAIAFTNDPSIEILVETQNFQRDEIHYTCGLP